MRRKNQASIVIVIGVLLVAASCSSSPPAPVSAPPQTGRGAVEQGLSGEAGAAAKTSTFILENIAAGVFQGVGAEAFTWLLSLVDPDPTAAKLQQIQDSVDKLDRDVSQLTADVQVMRTSMDQDFKNQQGVIQDTSLQPGRQTIDDATVKLHNFTKDTKDAIANKKALPKLNDYLGEYGDPRNVSALYNLLDHDLHTALTVGGSNTGGGSLIASADSIFAGQQAQAEAAKTGMQFDDRPLWQRLGLQPSATPSDIKAACDDLHARLPAAGVCATTDASGTAVPTVSYYDRMQTFINYYINYQVNGLQVLTTALYAWDANGTCPKPAQGDCAIAATRAREITTQVIDNVRQQLAMAGAPVSTAERFLERGSGESASLWRTDTTPATFSQAPPPHPEGSSRWEVPIDCELTGLIDESNQGAERMPCGAKDTPFAVKVPSERPEDQICVGTPTPDRDVATKKQSTNGIFDALASEWAACVRPGAGTVASGLRTPTRTELATALAKQPSVWIPTLDAFDASTFLSYTPAQVVCGNSVDDDLGDPIIGRRWTLSAINVKFDRWVNGLAVTYRKASDWTGSNQFVWYEPSLYENNTLGLDPTTGYEKDGPCGRVAGRLGCGGCGNGNELIKSGFTQCVLNDPLYRDWCYGHSNYEGRNLPADASTELRVWAVHSLVTCPDQRVDPGTGVRAPAWQMTGCTPDARPTGRDWEIPGCKTPAGQWTLCGSSWVDLLLKPPSAIPVAPAAPTTIAPTSSTSAAPSTTVTPSTAASTIQPAPTTPTTQASPTTPSTPAPTSTALAPATTAVRAP